MKVKRFSVVLFLSFDVGTVEAGGRASILRLDAGGWSGKEKKEQV